MRLNSSLLLPTRPLRLIRLSRAWAAACVASAVSFAGCTPKIGDACVASTDCSQRGDRLCDNSQPGGYCTQLNCVRNGCADESSCVLFGSALPGCSYDDRSGPRGARTARSFCMAKCSSDSDCRSGYVCGDPRVAPWSATILDDDQGKHSCLPKAVVGEVADASAMAQSNAVCSPVGPSTSTTDIDAAPPRVQDPNALPPLFPDAGGQGASDAGTDGG